MPVSADLVLVYAVNRPSDDTSTVGGAQDDSARPLDSQFTANAVVAAVSDGADTRTLTVDGITSVGAIESENIVLTGATEVLGTKTWSVIERLTLSATDASRTVTIKQGSGGTTRHTLNPNEDEGRVLFYGSVSDGSAKTYYEKCFWSNTSASALNSAEIEETADTTGLYAMGLEGTQDDTDTSTNRLTAPAGVTFNSGPTAVPGTNLAAGSGMGVWFRMSLGVDQAAATDEFESTIDGTSA